MKNALKICWRVLCVVSLLFGVLYEVLHLAGIEGIKLTEEITLSFQAPGVSIVLVNLTIALRDDVDAWLSRREVGLSYKARKKRRRTIQFVIGAVWWVAFGTIFALGRIGYLQDCFADVRRSGLLDLILTIIAGTILASAIPSPKDAESDDLPTMSRSHH